MVASHSFVGAGEEFSTCQADAQASRKADPVTGLLTENHPERVVVSGLRQALGLDGDPLYCFEIADGHVPDPRAVLTG
jgi:hypothetical protein